MIDPQTPEDWRRAAVLATVALLFDAARQYGLIVGGPVIDTDRCEDLITRAKAQGIVPTDAEVSAATDEFIRGLARGGRN
jgi:hypothetical protein